MPNELEQFTNEHCGGCKAIAAEALGVSLQTVYNNLEGDVSGSVAKKIEAARDRLKKQHMSKLAQELLDLCSDQ